MAKYGYANWFRAIFFVAVFLTLGWRVGIEIDRHRIPPYIELKLSDLKEEKGANGYVDLEVNVLSVRSARLAVYEDVHKDNSIVQKRTAAGALNCGFVDDCEPGPDTETDIYKWQLDYLIGGSCTG